MQSPSPKEIGAIVRQARAEAGITQAALAARIGASRFWVADLERGKPRAELGLTLKALRALGLAVAIEPKKHALHEEKGTGPFPLPDSHAPYVDLSRILERAAVPDLRSAVSTLSRRAAPSPKRPRGKK